MTQAIINKEKIDETWKDYLNLTYPWAETAKKRETAEWAKRLADEVGRGPLAVFAQQDLSIRSRLKARVVEREQLHPEQQAAISRLSKRLNPILPRRT